MSQVTNLLFVLYLIIGIAVLKMIGIDDLFTATRIETDWWSMHQPKGINRNLLFSFYIMLFILLWPLVLIEWFSNR